MTQIMAKPFQIIAVLGIIGLSGCASLASLGPYASWQGHPIEEFVAKNGNPDIVRKHTMGNGVDYAWRSCQPTGRVITYGSYGKYYSEEQYQCCTLTAVTDENKMIKYVQRGCGFNIQ